MRLRLLIVFLLIIIIPMIALAWFGYKTMQDEREIVKHRITALIQQKLASHDESISNLIKSYERKFNKLDISKRYSVNSIRQLVRATPEVHQLLILNRQGKRIFPSRLAYTQTENDFVRRSRPFVETFLRDNATGKSSPSPTIKRSMLYKKKNTYRKKRKKTGRWSRQEQAEVGGIRIEQHLYAQKSRKFRAKDRKNTIVTKSSSGYTTLSSYARGRANKSYTTSSAKNKFDDSVERQKKQELVKLRLAVRYKKLTEKKAKMSSRRAAEEMKGQLATRLINERPRSRRAATIKQDVAAAAATPALALAPVTNKSSLIRELRGWSIGFRRNGINLLYSYRKPDGHLIAAEVSRTRLIADIIRLLPTSKTDHEHLSQSLITLTNVHGGIVYQWGNIKPPAQSKPLISYSLSVPLNAWKLNYFSHKLDLSNAISYAPFAFGLSTVFFAVFGLAYYFYRESNRELKVASQRVTFVNQVSHELKTPLTNIRMYAELLEEDLEDSDDTTRKRMGVIIGESQRLSRMINNVLNFARNQRDKITVLRASHSPDNIIQQVLEQVKPALDKQNITTVFEGDASAEIRIDADILEQILHNLISNVLKYAQSGKHLGVDSFIKKDLLIITVSDKGPGIPRQMNNKIFDAFYRGNNKLSEGVSGTGIGLSISRELARLHGGDLTLINNRGGTTFQLTLKSE